MTSPEKLRPAHGLLSAAPPDRARDSDGHNTPATQEPFKHQDSASVIVRLPAEMLEQIDAVVRARPVRVPRHTWILEAIYEKLTRENNVLRRDRRAEDQVKSDPRPIE